MWAVDKAVCLMVLAYFSYADIRKREVYAYSLAAAGTGSVLFHLISRQMSFWLILGGAAAGGVFVLISKITEEGMGYGDSLGIMILGTYLGVWRILTVLSFAFSFLLCVLIPLLWVKRMSKKTALPFYPFLLAGYVCLLFSEGVKL